MRPTPRPGLHLLRRDVRTLQFGLEWSGVVAFADNPVTRAVLAAVDGFRDLPAIVQTAATSPGVAPDQARRTLEALIDCGALVDQNVLRTPPGVSPSTWAAWWLLADKRGTAAEHAAARSETVVHVNGTGRLAELIRDLLADEHVPVSDSQTEATAEILVRVGEVPRVEADAAMRRGLPYLCVGLRELVGVVGPFVLPGRNACLRCIDLSRAHRDPCWPTLVTSATATPPSVPAEPAALLATTAGYAAQEIAVWASGGLPVTSDHVVEIPYGLGEIVTVGYEPHPDCGCGWGTYGGTMTA